MRTFIQVASAGVFALIAGCTPAETAIVESKVPADVLSDVQCVSTELLEGALTDPLAILAQCGGLVLSQLVALAEAELASAVTTNASSALVGHSNQQGHHARVTLTEAQRARVTSIRDAAIKLQAASDGGTP